MAGFAQQMAELRASAKPQVTNFGSPGISSNTKITDTNSIKEFMTNLQTELGERNSIFKSPSQLVAEAKAGWTIANNLPEDVRKQVLMNPNAQKLRKRQAALSGTQGLFVDAGELYNDPNLIGYLEYSPQIKDTATQQAEKEQMQSRKGEKTPTQRTAEAGASQAEAAVGTQQAQTGYYQAETGLAQAQTKSVDLETRLAEAKSPDELAALQAEVRTKRAQATTAEATAGMAGQRESAEIANIEAQTDLYRAQIDSLYNQDVMDFTKLQDESTTERTKRVVDQTVSDMKDIASNYADQIQAGLKPVDYTREIVNNASSLVANIGYTGLDATEAGTGEAVTVQVSNALLDPSARRVLTRSFDEVYSAFKDLDQKAKFSGSYEQYADDMMDMYDQYVYIWNTLMLPLSKVDYSSLGTTQLDLANLADYQDKLDYMKYRVVYSGDVLPTDPDPSWSQEEQQMWNQEKSEYTKMWKRASPDVSYNAYYKILGKEIQTGKTESPAANIYKSLGTEVPTGVYNPTPDVSGVIRQKIQQ